MLTMEFLVASGIAVVTASGVFLLLRSRTWPVMLGLALLGYAVNVFLFASGKLWLNAAPILSGQSADTAQSAAQLFADPLPAALVLTAIVIGFATTGLLIELALRSYHDNGTDHVDGHAPQEHRHD